MPRFLDVSNKSVARTALEAVGRDQIVVHVSDYEAADDGLTDDLAAINAAINRVVSLGGGVVQLGRNHLVSDTITLSESVILRGHGGHSNSRGTVITCSAASGPAIKIVGRSAAIERVRISSTEARRTASISDGHGIFVAGSDVPEAEYPFLSRISLVDVDVRFQPTDGVHTIGPSEFSHFDLVTVTESGRHGFVLGGGTLAGFSNIQDPPFMLILSRCRAFECRGQALISLSEGGNSSFGVLLENFEALGCAWDSTQCNQIGADANTKTFQIQLGGRGHVLNRLDVEDQQYDNSTTQLGGHTRTALAAPSKGVLNFARSVQVTAPYFSALSQSWLQGATVDGLIMTWPTIFTGEYSTPQAVGIEIPSSSDGVDVRYFSASTPGATVAVKNQSVNARIEVDGIPHIGLSLSTGDWADGITPVSATISSGVLTTLNRQTEIAGEGAAADTVSTFQLASGNGGVQGLDLWVHRGSEDITIAHGTGNILNLSGVDIVMTSSENTVLHYLYNGTNWVQQSLSSDVITDNNETMTQLALTTGESTIPRRMVSANNCTASNGVIRLTYFTARKTETITEVRVPTGSVAAVGATLARVGIYSVAANGDLTLVASTANDTNLWIATNTSYTKALSSSFTKTRGTRYAVGVLVVGSSTPPNLLGINNLSGSENFLEPRMSAIIGGQTDLLSTISSGSLSGTTVQVYAVLVP